MDIFGVNGGELMVLLVVAVLVIGPARMPEYAAKLARLIKQVKVMADTAKLQLREQIGPEFDDMDWKQYDPRQYDPRRIVREALMSQGPQEGEAADFKAPSSLARQDPDKPTPYDAEAT